MGQNKHSGKGALVRWQTSSSTDQGLLCSKEEFFTQGAAPRKDKLGRQHRSSRNPDRKKHSVQLVDLLALEGV